MNSRFFNSIVVPLFLSLKSSVVDGACTQRTSCKSCLRDPSCTWWEEFQFCDEGCGMEGCGATVCPSDLRNCEVCLGGSDTPAAGQYSWSPSSGRYGKCVGSCSDPSVPADAACYKAVSDVDPTGYVPSDCASIGAPSVCSDASDCQTCLGNSNCFWWPEFNYCEEGCGMNGCGASVCPSDIYTCEDCLGGPGTPASGQYSWSPESGNWGECVSSCMDWSVPADASCYDSDYYGSYDCPNNSRSSRCQAYGTNCRKCMRNGCAWSMGECWDDCTYTADASCFMEPYFGPSICYSEGDKKHKNDLTTE